jgi:hypothetical protein
MLGQINVTTRVAQLSEMSILNRSSLITLDTAIAEEPTPKQSARDLPAMTPRRSRNEGLHGRENVGSAPESGHFVASYISHHLTATIDRGCVKTRCFKKIQKLFPLRIRLLFIYPINVKELGYVDSVIASTPHFQKSFLVFTQPGPNIDIHR